MIKEWHLIRFHPIFWFVVGSSLLTGYFYEVLLLFFIVFLHEIGHAAAALFFHWRVRKIELLPFGGVMETEEDGNRPLLEEVIVTLSGPFVHLPLILFSHVLLSTSFWSYADHELFVKYNIVLLLFNLFPIWPLDGGKLLFCILQYYHPFYVAQKKCWIYSFLSLCLAGGALAVFIPMHLQGWLLFLFFMFVHYKEKKYEPYRFLRFLLARIKALEKHPPPSPQFTKRISLHSSPQETVKNIRKTAPTLFYFAENGQLLPESYILETILKKRQRNVLWKEIIDCHSSS